MSEFEWTEIHGPIEISSARLYEFVGGPLDGHQIGLADPADAYEFESIISGQRVVYARTANARYRFLGYQAK